MKVWAVLKYDVETLELLHICNTKELAIKKLFEERDKLILHWKEMDELVNEEYQDDTYKQMIKNLSSNDYENWDNYPYDCLTIEELELETERIFDV